jgi:hypothetical protein
MHFPQNTAGGYAQYRYDNKQKWCQFKYWGKGASEDIMTTYMIMHCLSKIQGTGIINLLLPTTAHIILIQSVPGEMCPTSGGCFLC